jgi:hypothetical protein
LNSPYKFTDPLGLLSQHTGACGEQCGGSSYSNGPSESWSRNGDVEEEVETEQTAERAELRWGQGGCQKFCVNECNSAKLILSSNMPAN